jgi:hypothetical protein
MSWMKAECRECPDRSGCSAIMKFYVNYCGSRRKQLSRDIRANENLCRKKNWLKITVKRAA